VLIAEIKREAEAEPSGLCRYAEMLKDKFQTCEPGHTSIIEFISDCHDISFCRVFESRKLAICQVFAHNVATLSSIIYRSLLLSASFSLHHSFFVVHWTDVSWASFTYAAGWRKVTLKLKGAAGSPLLLLHHPTCQKARSTRHHPAPTKILKAASLNRELIRMSNKTAGTKPRRSIRSPTSTPRCPSIPSKAPRANSEGFLIGKRYGYSNVGTCFVQHWLAYPALSISSTVCSR
jgi:hypothetical protein